MVTECEELVEVLGDLVKMTVTLQRLLDASNRLLATLQVILPAVSTAIFIVALQVR